MEKRSSLRRKRKTKYNSKWEENYTWIRPLENNESFAKCNICDVTFSIAFGGNSNIVQHMKTLKHKNSLLKSPQIPELESPTFLSNSVTNMCRICLQNKIDDEPLISVFDCDSHDIKIAKKIYDISGIFIDNTDSLPNQICVKCNATLSIAYDFRIRCQQSDIQVRMQKADAIQLEEVKSELVSNCGSENLDEDYPKKEKSESLSDFDHFFQPIDESVSMEDDDNQVENKKILKESKPNSSTKRYCRFRSVWLKKYDFIKQGRDKGFVYCKVCNCEFSIAYGGEAVIIRHITRDKHYYNLNPSKKGEKMVSGTRVRCAQNVEELSFIICEVCGNKFPSKRHLRRHLKYHSDIKEHECEICKKQFRELMHLKRHMRVHTGEKPYACKHCGKKYGDYSSKIKHERVHTNERPYVCQTCGKAFMISDTLKKHIMTHTGEKPFCCEICNAKFSRKTHLQAHLKSITHKTRAENISLGKKIETKLIGGAN